MANPPPPYSDITGISRTVMKDNAQETLANYNGNARPGEIVADLTTDPPALYIGNNLGALTAISSAGTYGNSNVVTLLATFGSNTVSTTGNITGGNISTGSGSITGGNVNGNVFNGNVAFGLGTIGGAGNISSGNISAIGTIVANTIGASTQLSTKYILFDVVPLNNLTPAFGARAFVNDANLVAAGNFGAQITDGGANTVPVWSDGANWYIG
jgi:hypothetical protein